jgi:hypothetical protein
MPGRRRVGAPEDPGSGQLCSTCSTLTDSGALQWVERAVHACRSETAPGCTMSEAGREGLPAVPVLHVVIPVPLFLYKQPKAAAGCSNGSAK